MLDDGRLGEDGGIAENVIEPTAPGPVECERRGACRRAGVVGVGGACAMWAMPPVRSTLSTVVGFVLAVMLRKVRGSDKYDDDECEGEGEGEGGEVGGSGRMDASSSASRWLVGDHRESRASDRPSSDSVVRAARLSAALNPSREAGLRE